MKSPLQEVRDNPRLRIGLVVIVAIVWSYVVLDLRDRADARADAVKGQARRVLRLQQQSAQSEWLEAAKITSERRVLVDKGVWTAGTLGSAAGAVQDWLAEETKKAGLARAQIALVDGAETGPLGLAAATERIDRTGPSPFRKIRGRLSFDFDSATFDRFMAASTGGPHPLHVETMTLRNANPGGRVDLQFFVLARIDPKADAPAPASPAGQ